MLVAVHVHDNVNAHDVSGSPTLRVVVVVDGDVVGDGDGDVLDLTWAPPKFGARRPRRYHAGLAWFVYIVRCRDGTLYTGVAVDVARRLRDHAAGRGARYTRGRAPLALLHLERCADRPAALRREAAIKRLERPAKLRLCGLT